MAGVVCVVVCPSSCCPRPLRGVPRLVLSCPPCIVLFPLVLCVVGGEVWWCVLVNGGVCVVY